MKSKSPFYQMVDCLPDLRRDAAKRLKRKAPCKWADEIVIASCDVVQKFLSCADFYKGRQRIEPQDLLAAFLQKDGGLIRVWLRIRFPASRRGTALPDKKQMEALHLSVYLIQRLLLEIDGDEFDTYTIFGGESALSAIEACIRHDSSKKRQVVKLETGDYVWNLIDVAYRLTFVEHRIWYEHQEWNIFGDIWDKDHPYCTRELINNRYEAMRTHWNLHPGAVEIVRSAHEGLMNVCTDAPIAFVRTYPGSPKKFAFENAVFEALKLPVYVSYDDPTEPTGEGGIDEYYELSHILAIVRWTLMSSLRGLFRKRAEEKGVGEATRRLWYEADAELMSKVAFKQVVYTEEEARRIIELANRAQRETWVERQLASHGKRKDESVQEAMATPDGSDTRDLQADTHDYIQQQMANFAEAFLARAKKPDKVKHRKRRQGGTAHRGSKSTKMAKQLKRFLTYLGTKRINEKCRAQSVGAWANGYWNDNEAAMEAAAHEPNPDKRGYLNAKTLASAARKALWGT